LNLEEYETMYKMENFYWWYVARRHLLKSVVGKLSQEYKQPVILDVGSGTGINFSVLAQFGEPVSIDISEEALRYSKMRGVQNMVCSRLEMLAFSPYSFHIVTALDVLEHIEDDMQALQELWRVMEEDGMLMVIVPAYGFLWSEHDEALHHKRRYTASELRRKLSLVGYDVERITYYITFLFLPVLLVRFVQSVFKRSVNPKTSHIMLPGWINSLLIGILSIERFLLGWINLPFGVSLICLARKRANPKQVL
jgi:SAM-dependent methyltransferase